MQRERITITIDPELLPVLDELVDHETIRNRSQAIEITLAESLGIMGLKKVVIGEDDQDYSKIYPKVVELVRGLRIQNCYIVSANDDLLSKVLSNTLKDELEKERIFRGPKIIATNLTNQLGTASALHLIKFKPLENFLYFDLPSLDKTRIKPEELIGQIRSALIQHKRNQYGVTNLVSSPDGQNFQPVGISILNQSILSLIPAGSVDITQDLFPVLMKAGRVSAYVCTV